MPHRDTPAKPDPNPTVEHFKEHKEKMFEICTLTILPVKNGLLSGTGKTTTWMAKRYTIEALDVGSSGLLLLVVA